jgi:hypothetical protein
MTSLSLRTTFSRLALARPCYCFACWKRAYAASAPVRLELVPCERQCGSRSDARYDAERRSGRDKERSASIEKKSSRNCWILDAMSPEHVETIRRESSKKRSLASIWQDTVDGPISDELLEWPPDLFALTEAILERSEA